MRKSSSFGHRPPRGKAQVGGARVRGRPGGLTGKRPYGERPGRRDDAVPQGGAKMFRKRPAGASGKPGGARQERRDEGAQRGGAKMFRKPAAGAGGKPGGARDAVAAVTEPMRIAKAMARAGLCSRREAERWIAEGRVSVNGHVLKTPAVEIKPRDRVLVDGQPLPVSEPTQLWRYHKAKGLVTTHNDPKGRPTLFDALPPGLPRVISIGRLDFNTEGLILLTNDGELARHLELPATGWLRRYRVRAKGRVTQADLDRLRDGVEIEGVRYGPVEALVDTVQGANMWLSIGIREGKNREVRKVLASLGLEVNRLIRVAFGPFELSNLKPGEADVVPRKGLADQLGPELARQFGLVAEPAAKGAPAKGAPKGPRKASAPRPRGGRPQRRREDD